HHYWTMGLEAWKPCRVSPQSVEAIRELAPYKVDARSAWRLWRARGRKRLVKLATRALTQLRRRIWGVVPTNSLFSPEYPTFYLLSKVIEGAIRHHKAGEVLFTYEGYAPEYRDLLSRMEIDCVDLENLTRRTSKEGTTSWSRY